MSETVRTVKSASVRTTFVWGKMEGAVALYKTTAAVKEAEFETYRPPGAEGDRPRPEVSVPEPEPGGVGEPLEERTREDVEEDLAVTLGLSSVPAEAPGRAGPRRGIYRDDGSFLDLTEKIDAITEATQLEEMRVVGFVPSPAIPRVLVTGSYYLAAEAGASKLLKAFEAGMLAHRVVAVVKWTKRTRQALGVVMPSRKAGLVVLQLSWPEERLAPSERTLAYRRAELTAEEEALARELVAAMHVLPGAVREQVDDAVTMRRQLRRAAEAGLVDAWEAPSAPERADIEDLEAALRESIPGGA